MVRAGEKDAYVTSVVRLVLVAPCRYGRTMARFVVSVLFLVGLLWLVQSDWTWSAVDAVSEALTRLIVDNIP